MKLISNVRNYINNNSFSMIYKNNSLDVINYNKIIDFNSDLISFCDNDNTYYIKGNNLVISKMLDNEILIIGDIKEITFL